jgi:histidine triad (HIT) family protein
MNDPNCIFCKIIAGQIPCKKVYEDDQVLAFLDIGPLAEGHLLIIPKSHYVTLDEMAPEAVASTTRVLPHLAGAVRKAMAAQGYNILQNNGKVSGQVVNHVHFHIIPRVESDGLGYRWNASAYPEGRADEVLGRIREALA